MMNVWMVHAGRTARTVEEYVSHGVIALDDRKLCQLARTMRFPERHQLVERKH